MISDSESQQTRKHLKKLKLGGDDAGGESPF